MSIGARIKEERGRLGFSQTAFAALANSSRGAQLKWEKDEAAPNAYALVAWAEAGADALYILSGRRQAEPFNVRAEADMQATIDKLEDTLHHSGPTERKMGLSHDEVREAARLSLEQIATSTSPDVSEAVRERADDVLRIKFPDDKGAAKRRAARAASLLLQQDNLDRDLDDVLEGMNLKLPSGLRHHLASLASDHGIRAGELIPTLREVGRLVSQVAHLEQPYGKGVQR